MAGRTGTYVAGALAACCLAVLGQAPAHAEDAEPGIAGTFQVRGVDSSDPVPSFGFPKEGRTYRFGAGCAAGARCEVNRAGAGGQGSDLTLSPRAGGFVHREVQDLACSAPDGSNVTPGGGRLTSVTRLAPVAPAGATGSTYATRLRGTIDSKLEVTAKGRAVSCTISPGGTLVETWRTRLTGTLAPLAAPEPIAATPPMAATSRPEARRAARSSSMAAFTLPQTARQQASAAAAEAGTRSSVPAALVTPSEALDSVRDRLPRDLLLVALLGLLVVFPSQIFNSTYEEHHERIERRLARLLPRRRRRGAVIPSQRAPADDAPPPGTGAAAPPPRARRLAIFFACVLAGTLLGGLLDPGFGPDRASYALTTGIFVSVLLAVLVGVIAGRVFRSATRRERGWYLRAIPSALLIAAACVLVSRLTGFAPGYLYGVLGGAVFVAALEARAAGRAEVVGTLVTVATALLAWVGFGWLAARADTDPTFWLLSTDALLAALFIGGLEGVLLGLIPLRFLPGARIKEWSWLIWGVLLAVVLYLFVHVLLMPESGYLGRSTTAATTVTIALFVGFGAASVVFWLYFRLRPADEPLAAPAGPAGAVTGTVTGAEPDGVEAARRTEQLS
jgi:hypothetical protein